MRLWRVFCDWRLRREARRARRSRQEAEAILAVVIGLGVYDQTGSRERALEATRAASPRDDRGEPVKIRW